MLLKKSEKSGEIAPEGMKNLTQSGDDAHFWMSLPSNYGFLKGLAVLSFGSGVWGFTCSHGNIARTVLLFSLSLGF